jgi:hypothetical protein
LQALAHAFVEIEKVIGDLGGRHAVGLGEQDIEGDRRRPQAPEPLDEIGHHVARPGPLAMRLEALLVDIDDDHRPRRRVPRLDLLVDVEGLELQDLQRRRIPQFERHEERGQQQPSARADPTWRTTVWTVLRSIGFNRQSGGNSNPGPGQAISISAVLSPSLSRTRMLGGGVTNSAAASNSASPPAPSMSTDSTPSAES